MHLHSRPPLSRSVRRLGEVTGILAKYGLAEWLSGTEFDRAKSFFVGQEGEMLARESRATRIRLAATELGTTYIKFGQMLSTRTDLVGQEVADELSKLQEGVPPDPPEVTLATVAAELGRPIGEIFAEFDPTPIGSASIGQVHRARLLEGCDVVVKVQHAGIEVRIRDDLEILQRLAELAENSPALKRYQPAAVVRDFNQTTSRELDFNREARNLQQFATNFASDPTVYFPQVIPELGTSRVLTMELIRGISLHESDQLDRVGISRDELARRGAAIWLEMVFRDGFFHADPHPGNLLVLPDGVIGVLDCGMVNRIDDTLREKIEGCLVAIANHDGGQLARLIMQICSAPTDFDEKNFTADVADFVAFYGKQSIQRLQLVGALNEMVGILNRYTLVLPSGVSVLLKTFVLLEGTARLLNPAVNLLELTESYQRKILLRRLSPRARFRKWQRVVGEWRQLGDRLPTGISDLFDKIQQGKFDIHLEHRRLEPFVNRLAMGLVTSALYLGSALLLSHRVPPVVDGYSLGGVLGCLLSVALGARLVRKIWTE